MPRQSTEAERAYLTRIIARAPLFAGAAEADVAELARCARPAAAPRGKPLAPAKGREDEIYILERGAAALLERDPAAGKTILLALYGPADVVGVADAVADKKAGRNGARREIKALSNVTYVAVEAADFLRVMRRSPELTEAALKALGRDLDSLAARFAASVQAPFETRLAAFLAQIAAIETGNEWEPNANIGRLQQSLIADMLGVSREHVNRTLTMWEKSGLIFQTKSGDVVIENRKRLRELAGAGERPPSPEHDRRWEIEAHLNYGLNEIAYDLAIEGARRAPKDDKFKYYAVLAMARTGAMKEALALVESFRLSTDDPDEDIASIGPRLSRDLAFAAKDGPDRSLLKSAAEGYEKVFRSLGAAYPGVNAAATFAMIGETARAKAIAADVGRLAEAALAELDEDEPSYWARSTLAECRLLEGDAAGAAAAFAAAMRAPDAAPGKKATTRKQLRRLSASLPIDRAWIDRVAPQADVFCFCGPLAGAGPAENAPLERLKRRIAQWLERREVCAAIGPLAAGADIVIAEAVIEAGVPLHVHLPTAPEEFIESSAASVGGDWRARCIACIEKAQTIDWARRTNSTRGAYRLGSRIAMGKAIRQAEELEAKAVGYFSLQRGRTAANSISHECAQVWEALGLEIERVEDDWPLPRSLSRDEGLPDYLFALVTDAAVPPAGAAPRFALKDAHIAVYAFATPTEAAEAARRMNGASRLWLDVAVGDAAGAAGRDAFRNALVTAACRPLTAPGKVYASESFANAATATPGWSLKFEYVGLTATEEKLDPCPLFLISL